MLTFVAYSCARGDVWEIKSAIINCNFAIFSSKLHNNSLGLF